MAQGNRPSDALALFHRMRVEGLKPNEVTVLGALSACAQLGASRKGETLHGFVREEQLDMNVQVCNAVIDMYAKCGSIDMAFDVFNGMRCPRSLVSRNTIIMALGMDGRGSHALELFSQMCHAQVKPDAVTYLAALCACNHAGLVADGLNSLIESGLKPNVKHYGTLVDLLGRGGQLEEAYQIITSMPMVPDVVLWQTLLGASKTYGNVEMAERSSISSSCGDGIK
ncbi:hypothetical protein NE237_028893 [Protea cynaroides]|uniref:Pentatricopeptide repeat-containing protein n=1 Tax=Protea cynaroides TaxID=273540 RepID=A0A9Q0GS33_9MAGN|nr:hypothetical protein NE237_028893 [Protea cynaroides]